MTADDHAALARARPARWPARTATRPSSRAACTSPTATRSTGPTAATGSSCTRSSCTRATRRSARPPGSTRPTSRSARRPSATRTRSCYLMEQAGCLYAIIGKAHDPLRPVQRGLRDLARLEGRIRSARTPPATAPGSGPTRATTVPGGHRPVGLEGAGHRCGWPGRRRTRTTSTAGLTTVRSPAIKLPATVGNLMFRYYFAHASNSSSADVFRAYVEAADGTRTLVREELGAANTDRPAWTSPRCR